MAETGESEALITEIIKTIKEYTKKDINNLEEVKAEFKENLKTHRPIKLCDYEFGFSHTGKKNNYLIIKEENDKSKVRQFLKQKDYWYCSKRTYVAHKCISPSLRIKYGILFAPLNHAKECKLKEYSFVMEVQRLLKEGKIKEAKGLTISKKRLLNNTSNQSLSTSILSTTDIENESILDLIDETSENADLNISSIESSQTSFPVLTGNGKESGRSSVKTEIDNDDYEETEFKSLTENSAVNIDSNITSSSLAKASSPALTKKLPKSGITAVKRELKEEDDCIIIDEPSVKKPKMESKIEETFPFELPSNSAVKKACEKLEIEYSRSVYKFWGDIVFENIVPISKNIKAHSFRSPNFFACLSLFFTGNIDACFDIQKAINRAFRDELTAAGKVNAAEIENIYASNTVSAKHLEFIAKFLFCKIGIYENGNLKKYGNWENQNNADVLTLILSSENGFYSVVLDL